MADWNTRSSSRSSSGRNSLHFPLEFQRSSGFCSLVTSSPSRLYVTGHTGMAGSALLRRFSADPSVELITSTRAEVDLTGQSAVRRFLRKTRPDAVIVAAARVGGIHANQTLPATFLFENLAISTNLIHESHCAGVKRLLFLGSSCIYPKLAPQPMREDALLTGPLEPTNEAYAIAKIAGVKLCQFYRRQYGVVYHSVMPTNLYGPGDNYHPEFSHVIPGLIRRFHEARLNHAPAVAIWGSGKPLREFLHVDDLAEACRHLLLLENPPDVVNAGSGQEISIAALAQLVARITSYQGRIVHDLSKPDGTPRKLLDSSVIHSTGWSPQYDLEKGLRHAYDAFLQALQAGTLRQA